MATPFAPTKFLPLVNRTVSALIFTAPTCPYYRVYVGAMNPANWIGQRSGGDPPPVGSHDAAYDPVEGAVTDSTVDQGTGFTGGYRGPFDIHVLMLAPDRAALAQFLPYGATLDEAGPICVVLAAEIVPYRGDFFIAANGDRYVIGETQWPIGQYDQPVAYATQLDRRASGDPIYSV